MQLYFCIRERDLSVANLSATALISSVNYSQSSNIDIIDYEYNVVSLSQFGDILHV